MKRWRTVATRLDETWHRGRPQHRPHCVRCGHSSPSPKGTAPNFWPMSVVAKRLDGSRIKMSLGREVGLDLGHIVLDGASSPQRGTPQFSAHVCCGQTTGWIEDQDVTWQGGSCLGPGDIVLDGDPAPLKRGTAILCIS